MPMRLCKYVDENTINVDGAILYGTTLFLCRAFNKQIKENNNPDEEWLVDINIPEHGNPEDVKYRLYVAPPNMNIPAVVFIKEEINKKNGITITMNEHSLLKILDSVLHNQLFLPTETTTGDATVVQLSIVDEELEVKQAICSITRFTEKRRTAIKMCKLAQWSLNTTAVVMPFKVFLVYVQELSNKFDELQSQGFDLNLFELHMIFEKEFVPHANHFKFSVVPNNPQTLVRMTKKYAKDDKNVLNSITLKMTYTDFEMIMMPAYNRVMEKSRKNSFMQKDSLLMIISEDDNGPDCISFRYKEKSDVWEEKQE